MLDPTYPEIDESAFKKCDWKEFYGVIREPVPPNAPAPHGKPVDLRLFVDSSHADDQKVRRSRTGYFVYMNMAPIKWLSKKQATVETAVFGAEFVAMKIGMEDLRGICYKLHMIGVELSGPTYIYGDNMSVIHNTQSPESTLRKEVELYLLPCGTRECGYGRVHDQAHSNRPQPCRPCDKDHTRGEEEKLPSFTCTP